MRIEDINIDLIDISPRHRQADPDWVEALKDDIDARGQHTPIQVAIAGNRFVLIKGRRRVLAARTLGLSSLKAVVLPEFSSDAAIMLAQISAQVLRGKLIVLDRALAVAQWRMIYEETTGQVKPGPKAGSKKQPDDDGGAIRVNLTLTPATQKIGLKLDPLSDEVFDALAASFAGTFSEAAQRALGLNKEAVKRYLRIARIDPTVRQQISLHRIADHQSELLALSAEPADRQQKIANLLTSNPPAATTVADALAMVLHTSRPVAPQPWERLSERFVSMSDDARRRFVSENRDVIEAVMAELDEGR